MHLGDYANVREVCLANSLDWAEAICADGFCKAIGGWDRLDDYWNKAIGIVNHFYGYADVDIFGFIGDNHFNIYFFVCL